MEHFAPAPIVNLTQGGVLCPRTIVADRPLARTKGLLGRTSLPSGEGLLLRPAGSIHTAFMRFPIDAVFLDRSLHVLRIAANLPPWRGAMARHARAVLELPAGESARRRLSVDDQLAVLEPAPPQSTFSEAAPVAHEQRDCTPEASGEVITVLLESSDRRFRSVAGALLSRRGWSVSTGDLEDDVLTRALQAEVDVVVLDATPSLAAAARVIDRVEAMGLPVGIVVVSGSDQDDLQTLPVIPKWGPLVGLCSAIERASEDRTRERGSHGTG